MSYSAFGVADTRIQKSLGRAEYTADSQQDVHAARRLMRPRAGVGAALGAAAGTLLGARAGGASGALALGATGAAIGAGAGSRQGRKVAYKRGLLRRHEVTGVLNEVAGPDKKAGTGKDVVKSAFGVADPRMGATGGRREG